MQHLPNRTTGTALLILATLAAGFAAVAPAFAPLYVALACAGYGLGLALPRHRGTGAAARRLSLCCAAAALAIIAVAAIQLATDGSDVLGLVFAAASIAIAAALAALHLFGSAVAD